MEKIRYYLFRFCDYVLLMRLLTWRLEAHVLTTYIFRHLSRSQAYSYRGRTPGIFEVQFQLG